MDSQIKMCVTLQTIASWSFNSLKSIACHFVGSYRLSISLECLLLIRCQAITCVRGLQNGSWVPTFLVVDLDSTYFSSRAEQHLRCTNYIHRTDHSWIELDTARVISIRSKLPNTTVTLHAWKYKLWFGPGYVWHIVTLTHENCHDANLVITGGTRGCPDDNLWYRHWQQSWHQDSYPFQWFPISMLITEGCFTDTGNCHSVSEQYWRIRVQSVCNTAKMAKSEV